MAKKNLKTAWAYSPIEPIAPKPIKVEHETLHAREEQKKNKPVRGSESYTSHIRQLIERANRLAMPALSLRRI